MTMHTAESRQSLQNLLSPDQFRQDYTTYYETETSDSPSAGRQFLIQMVLRDLEAQLRRQIETGTPTEKVSLKVLNIGAGRQILEHELQSFPLFQQLRPYITYVTGDIANIHSKQLLAPEIAHHVQLDGSKLPLVTSSVDLAFSCMAIDFMPREAFDEAKRVLKSGGTFMAALHHPDLMNIAMVGVVALRHKYRSITQKLKHGKMSKKYPQYVAEKAIIERQLSDSQFLLNTFPQHIFHSTEEIYAYFASVFSIDEFSISVSEHSNRCHESEIIGEQISLPNIRPQQSENGWYFVKIQPIQA